MKSIECLLRQAFLQQHQSVVDRSISVDGHTLTLHGVLYVPQLRFNLLSTKCLHRESFIGYDSLLNTLYYGEDEEIITTADSSSGIPIINTNPYSESSTALLPCQKGNIVATSQWMQLM